MNGYKLIANGYRVKYPDEVSKIKIYDFLSTCDEEDFRNLFDSGAFIDYFFPFLVHSLNKIDLPESYKSRIDLFIDSLKDDLTLYTVDEMEEALLYGE